MFVLVNVRYGHRKGMHISVLQKNVVVLEHAPCCNQNVGVPQIEGVITFAVLTAVTVLRLHKLAARHGQPQVIWRPLGGDS